MTDWTDPVTRRFLIGQERLIIRTVQTLVMSYQSARCSVIKYNAFEITKNIHEIMEKKLNFVIKRFVGCT